MPVLSDMHVHSTFSDGKMSIPELVDFYGSRGFGCIAITDHICEDKTFLGVAASYLNYTLSGESFPEYQKLIEAEGARAWDQYRMLVLPGFELSKNSWFNQRSAHILGIGVSKFVSADGDILKLLKEIRDQGAISVAAHPVSTRRFEPQTFHLWNRREELRDKFDAWEVASGATWFDEVEKTRLPKIASSDLHHPRQINSWKTVLHCEKHPEAVLAAVREQNLSFHFYRDPVTASHPLPARVRHTLTQS